MGHVEPARDLGDIQRRIAERKRRGASDDAQILGVIEKMVKTRKESVEQFKTAGRDDLVAKEASEITQLQAYLPAQLSQAELDALIASAIASTGAASIKDMGKVVAAVKQQAAGRADMGAVSAQIKAKLGA